MPCIDAAAECDRGYSAVILDFNHGSDWTPTAIKEPSLTEAVTKLIDGAIIAQSTAEYEARGSGIGDVAKKRIGAGYIGTECDRELAFRYHRYPVEEKKVVYVTKGELNRHGAAGHWTEAKTAEWMKAAGFDLRTHKVDADGNPMMGFNGKPQQIGWKAARDPETRQYRMAGEVDGAILGVPEELKNLIQTPCLWESKKATNKKWLKFSREGVAKADPKYYGQLQANMAHLQVEQTLFMMLNLDTMKYYPELVTFDPAKAQELIDRAVNVMLSQSPEEMARIASKPDFFMCKFCDYQGACWSS